MNIPSSVTDAVNGLPDAAFLVDDSGLIVAVNEAATSMFGFSRGQLIGSLVDDLMPSSAREYHKGVRAKAVEDRQPRSFTSGNTFECERRGGELFQADINLSPTTVDGVPMTWAIVRDLDGPAEANEGRRQALSTLDAIGRMATSAFDLEHDFAAVASGLNEVVPHDRIAVMLVSENDPEMAEVLFTAGDVHPDYPVGTIVPVRDSAIQRVRASGQSISFTQKQRQNAPSAVKKGLDNGYTETFGVPLIDSEGVFGMVMAATKRPRMFSEFQKNLIARMGEHLAVAITSQKMRSTVHQQAEEIGLVSEIGQRVSSSRDLGSAFASAEMLIKSFIHFDRFSVYSVDIQERTLTRSFVLGEKLNASGTEQFKLISDGVSVLKDVLSEQKPVLMDRDQLVEGSAANEVFTPLVEAGYQQVLVVPLVVTKRPVGFIIFGSKSEGHYSENEIALAGRIGEQVAGPVANAFLLDRTRSEAEVEATLLEIGRIAGSTFDLQSTADQLGPLVRKLVDSKSMLIAGVVEDHQFMRIFYVDYLDVPEEPGLVPDLSLNSFHPIKGTTSEIVLKTRKPILVNAGSGEEFKNRFPGAGSSHAAGNLGSVINVPLVANNEVYGLLGLRTDSSEGYSDSDLEIASRVAAQLASAVALIESHRRDASLTAERFALAAVGNIMGSAHKISDVWDDFASVVSTLVPFNHIALTGMDGSTGMVRFLADYLVDGTDQLGRDPGELFPIDGTVAEELMRRRKGFVNSFADTSEWVDMYPKSNPKVRGVPISSMIAVPLIWGDRVVAGLYVHSAEVEAYEPADLAVIERVGAQIAGPVAGSLLRDRETEIAEQREVLVRISSLLGAATDLNAVWGQFSVFLTEILPFDRCVIVGIDSEAGRANVLHDSHTAVDRKSIKGLRTAGESYDLAGTVAEHLTKQSKGIVLNQSSPDELLSEYFGVEEQGFNLPFLSNLGVPLSWGGEVVACMFFGSLVENAYGDSDIEIAERVAAQVAGPIAGAIVRQREAELVEERQRREAAEIEAASLAELNETKSNFVGAMSHELKTPLTSIVAFSDILSRENGKGLEGRPLQQIKVIQRNARHLEGMINELLDLSRMESGRFEIVRAPFDFVAMVGESFESSQPQFEAMRQKIDYTASDDVLLVNGDRERLIQVVNNLLSNASKYSPEESDVEVEVDVVDRWLVFEVSDRGHGVPADNPEGLFEMFHRADNEITRRVPGAGIGLHVSKRIIDEHGGEISLSPRGDGGAIARFRIPLGLTALG
jgi:PAS domain S-box-containing protein